MHIRAATGKLPVASFLVAYLQGFLLKAQASKHKPSCWDFEAEALAIMGRAGLLFSIGIRCFFAFGILVRSDSLLDPLLA